MKRNRLPILLLAFLAPLFVAGAVASFQKYRRIAGELYRQESRLNELIDERSVLQKAIEYFSSATGIEKEARARFNLVREGEITVILVSPKISPPEPSPEPPQSFFRQMLQWIGRK